MIRTLALICTLALLSGCVSPSTSMNQEDNAPTQREREEVLALCLGIAWHNVDNHRIYAEIPFEQRLACVQAVYGG